MRSSGRKTFGGLLPLLLLLAGCTEPVVELEEPAAVESCEWLVPVGIELVNDYVYTLEESDLGATGADPALLPSSLVALNARGEELDRRAAELDCDLAEINAAIVAATAGIESEDPEVKFFLETVRSGVVERSGLYGEWLLIEGTMGGSPVAPLPDWPATLLVDEEAAQGSSGCNGYYFPLLTEDGEWVPDDTRSATSTELMCVDEAGAPNTALADFERTYLLMLETIDDYIVAGDTLTLYGPDVELRYTRRPGASD
jgi:hypothetical protein